MPGDLAHGSASLKASSLQRGVLGTGWMGSLSSHKPWSRSRGNPSGKEASFLKELEIILTPITYCQGPPGIWRLIKQNNLKKLFLSTRVRKGIIEMCWRPLTMKWKLLQGSLSWVRTPTWEMMAESREHGQGKAGPESWVQTGVYTLIQEGSQVGKK